MLPGPTQQMPTSVFFNRGSSKPLRFRQWHPRPNRIKERELNDICGHYRRIFWALSASKVVGASSRTPLGSL